MHISLAKFFLPKIYRQSSIFSLFFTFFNVSPPKNLFIPISTYELVDLRLSCPPIISKKFRDCFWRNWDDWRNIPKSRFFDQQFIYDWNGIFRNWGGFWALNTCPLLFYHFLCPSKPIKIIGIQALRQTIDATLRSQLSLTVLYILRRNYFLFLFLFCILL